VTRISDLWRGSHNTAKDHPYVVNYLGMQNLVEAAKMTGVGKIIRISGLSVGVRTQGADVIPPRGGLLALCRAYTIRISIGHVWIR
jgi:hypothetical protein